jgi:hypothetical protein
MAAAVVAADSRPNRSLGPRVRPTSVPVVIAAAAMSLCVMACGSPPISFTRCADGATGEDLERVVLKLSSKERKPVGIERILDADAAQAREPRERCGEVSLAGLDFEEALERILTPGVPSLGRRFALSWNNGVAQIAPHQRLTFLDEAVSAFRVDKIDISTAVRTVYQLVDRSYPMVHGSGGSVGDPALESLLEKPQISVSLNNSTIRQILNAIVVAHGDASWVVHYQSSAGEYAGSELSISSFEGLRLAFRARQ